MDTKKNITFLRRSRYTLRERDEIHCSTQIHWPEGIELALTKSIRFHFSLAFFGMHFIIIQIGKLSCSRFAAQKLQVERTKEKERKKIRANNKCQPFSLWHFSWLIKFKTIVLSIEFVSFFFYFILNNGTTTCDFKRILLYLRSFFSLSFRSFFSCQIIIFLFAKKKSAHISSDV